MKSNTPITARQPSKFVRKLDELINSSEKTQRQIAHELGYENSNIITMFKQGTTRLPLERVPQLAFILGEDKAGMTRLWLETYEPNLLATLDETVGPMLTASEKAWVEELRQVFEGDVPKPNDSVEARLKDFKQSL